MNDFRWRVLQCHNPNKAWITNDAGDKITKLIAYKTACLIVKAHNNVIDYIEAKK